MYMFAFSLYLLILNKNTLLITFLAGPNEFKKPFLGLIKTRWLLVALLMTFLLIAPAVAQAQYTLQGRVTELATAAPLEGVEVYDLNSGRTALTDSSGFYKIKQLQKGWHRLVVYSLQHQALKDSLYLSGNALLSFALSKREEKLQEVTVTGKSTESYGLLRLKEVEGTALYAGKKTEVVRLQELVGNIGGGNARQLYAQVAGLNIYESAYAGLQLHIGARGLNPNRTSNFNTRQNGYDISADVLGYPESYYTPPAEALRQIDVIRGAASLQYGTQFGGLVNFQLEEPNREEKFAGKVRETAGSFGLYSHYHSISGTHGKWSYLTFYKFRRGDGYRPNARFSAHNAYARVDFRPNEKATFTAEYTFLDYLAQQPGGLTDSQFDENQNFSNRERNWFGVNWNLYALKWQQEFSPRTTLSLQLFGLTARRQALGFRGNPSSLNINPITEIDERNSEGNFINPRDLIDGSFNNWGVETRLLHRYLIGNRRSIFLVGSKYYHASNTSRQGPGSTGSDADFTFAERRFPNYANQSNFTYPNRNLALFTENVFYLGRHFSVTPGLRVEYIKTESRGEFQQVNFDNAGNPILRQTLSDNRTFERGLMLLGLGVSYKPRPKLELYANFSQNYRSVTFSDIRTVNPTFVIDPNITDEEGFTADLGLRGNWGKAFQYDMSSFALLYDNRIGLILNDRAQRVRKNIGTALMYGLEWKGTLSLSQLLLRENSPWQVQYFVNAAFTASEYLESEDNNVTGNRVEFVPLLNLKTGLQANYQDWAFNLQYTYLTEQYTDVENSAVPKPGDLREGIIGAIPAYGVVDLSAQYDWKSWRLEAGLNNLLNEKYFTRRAIGYPGPGIMPASPRSFYVGVEWRF